MLGANKLRINPADATSDPTIVTTRHPYLLVSALAMGPGKTKHDIIDQHRSVLVFTHYKTITYENLLQCSSNVQICLYTVLYNTALSG